MQNYVELTRDDIAALDRRSTLFVSCVAPVEVHGGHLPVGTDLFVAEGILQRTVDRLDGWTVVRLPPLWIGAQPIPAPGSLRVKSKILEAALLAWGRALAGLGFRYWIVFDNHGGATHQLAEASAARKLRKAGMCLIVPFLSVFQDMVLGRTGLGLKPGYDGGIDDAHAGTNETSLMLALSPERVRPGWACLPRWKPTKAAPMGNLGRALGQPFLGMAKDWFAAPDNPHYVGCPAEASADAGERMVHFHVEAGLSLLQDAVEGRYAPPKIYPWHVAALTKALE